MRSITVWAEKDGCRCLMSQALLDFTSYEWRTLSRTLSGADSRLT